MRHFWKWIIAALHLNDDAVCEMSIGRGPFNDFHDYHDSDLGVPLHGYEHRCRRCQKTFYI